MSATNGENLIELPLSMRYPGVMSFQDNDTSRKLFFGRKKEAQTLLHHMLAENLLVVFSKSGYGKTSLLQAGVFQKLREKGYYPILVRFNKSAYSPQELIKTGILSIQESGQYDIVSDVDRDCSLKAFLKKTEIWSRNDKLLTPIIVFDQFEEMFTFEHNLIYRKEFFEVIADILLENHDLQPYAKFVLSLREDFLGYLEKMATSIPSVFTNRFRLEALSMEAAETAIREPARLVDSAVVFGSAPYEYTDAAVQQLLSFLSLKMSEDVWIQSDEIEPFQLQILCSELEKRVIRGDIKPVDGHMTIGEEDLGGKEGLQQILGGFYSKQIADVVTDLQLTRDETRQLKDVLENDLITGIRRVPLAYDKIISRPGFRREALDMLIRNKLLRVEKHQNSTLVEISHDTLVDPMLKAYAVRKEDERKTAEKEQSENARRKKLLRLIGYGSGIFILLAIASIILYNNWELRQEKQKEKQERFYYGSMFFRRTNPTLSYKLLKIGYNLDHDNPKINDALKDFEKINLAFITHYINRQDPIESLAYDKDEDALVVNGRYIYDRDALLKKEIFYDEPSNYLENKVLLATNGSPYRYAKGDDDLYIMGPAEDTLIRQPMNHADIIQLGSIELCPNQTFLLIGRNLYKTGTKQHFELSVDGAKLSAVQPATMSSDRLVSSYSRQPGISGQFSGDSRFLLVTIDSAVTIFKLDLLQSNRPIRHLSEKVSKSIFSSTGCYLATLTGGQDTIKVWNVDSTGKNDTLRSLWSFPVNHRYGELSCLAISPDGSQILAGFKSNLAVLRRRVDNISKEYMLVGHTSEINAVSFLKDNNEVATGDNSGTVCYWKIDQPGNINQKDLAGLGPYDEYYYGLEPEAPRSIASFQDTIGIIMDYFNSLPKSNPIPWDTRNTSSLRRSIQELTIEIKSLLASESFSRQSKDLQKDLLETFSNLVLDSAALLLNYEIEPKPNRYERYRQYDIWRTKRFLIDTIESRELNRIASDFDAIFNYYFDSLSNYKDALDCEEKETSIYQAFLTKHPEDTLLKGKRASNYNNLIACYLYLDQLEDAKKMLDTARLQMKYGDDSSHFYTCLIRYYLFTGKKTEAQALYDQTKDYYLNGDPPKTVQQALFDQLTKMKGAHVPELSRKNVQKFMEQLKR